VLEAALKAGHKPVPLRDSTLRRVTPGSREIVAYLKEHGLIDVYEAAGFVVGAPSCSYCLGIGADVAGEGEVWLSSQNRNFKNRMGKGSIANLASAAVVAASSLTMTVTDPAPFLAAVDQQRYAALRQWIQQPAACHSQQGALPDASFVVTEPKPQLVDPSAPAAEEDPLLSNPQVWGHLPTKIKGRVQRFGGACASAGTRACPALTLTHPCSSPPSFQTLWTRTRSSPPSSWPAAPRTWSSTAAGRASARRNSSA
jgi:Aconitase family (aconitate hydratase)